jgi:hypothetical protein
MRRLIVLAASLVPLLAFSANDVSAQALSGGIGPGGARAIGGPSGGGRALSRGGLGGGYRPSLGGAGYGYRGGSYRAGGGNWGYRPNRWYGGGYYGRRGYYGGGWGLGAGALAAGAILGSAAAYPYYYGTPYYDEPGYYYYRRPYYAAPVSSGVGDYCRTPVRTCQLINPAELGASCSCRVAGGRARGSVVP